MSDSFRSTDNGDGWRRLEVKDTGELICLYKDKGGYYSRKETAPGYEGLPGLPDKVSDLRRAAQRIYERLLQEDKPMETEDSPIDIGARERTKTVERTRTVTKSREDVQEGDWVKINSRWYAHEDVKMDSEGFAEVKSKINSAEVEFGARDGGRVGQYLESEVKVREGPGEDAEGEGAEGDTPDNLRELAKQLAEKLGVEFNENTEDLESEVRKLREEVSKVKTEGLRPLKITVPDKVDVDIPAGTYHRRFPDVLTAVSEGEHVMLVGPAGSGKSHLAKQVHDSLERGVWASISCNPTMTETVLKGFVDAHGVFREPPQYPSYVEGGTWLVDEIDGGSPGLLTGMNQMLSNDTYAFANGMAERASGFVVIATANTFGRGADRTYVGRNALDAATMDRFTQIEIDYDENLESVICMGIAEAREVSEQVAGDWLVKVREWRKLADEARLNVVISPRTAMAGIKYLSHGWSFDKIAHARFAAGLSDEQKDKLAIAREV